jgi:Flp pilus assembly protein TadG
MMTLAKLELAKSQLGSSLIELAISLPLLFLIVFSMVDYGFYIQKAIQVQDAASAGAAYGAIPGNFANSATMIQLANFDATGSATGASGFTATATNFYTCTPGGAHVTVITTCSTGAPFHYVQVTASLAATSLLPVPGMSGSQTIAATAIYRVEVTP